ncbi:unnamed protein product [Arctogadus glacialis]
MCACVAVSLQFFGFSLIVVLPPETWVTPRPLPDPESDSSPSSQHPQRSFYRVRSEAPARITSTSVYSETLSPSPLLRPPGLVYRPVVPLVPPVFQVWFL